MTIVNTYTQNTSTLNFTNTTRHEKSNKYQFSHIGGPQYLNFTHRQNNNNKEIAQLNLPSIHLDLVDVYTVVNPTTKGYTVFSAAHRNFSQIDNILSNHVCLGKYKRIKSILDIL